MRVLITGGAGFIGSNAARRFRGLGHEIVLFDNLSRPAARYNLRWLQGLCPEVRFVQGDVRNESDLRIIEQEPFDAILHLAAQVAVTTSIVDPVEDWGSNALGTFRVLEAIRRRYGSTPDKAPLLVYGYGAYGLSMDPYFSIARLRRPRPCCSICTTPVPETLWL